MVKYPKIGIRPTIDARQDGVRESLEKKTMGLAKAVAALISRKLKNGNGSPVECVIADTTIGRVAQSAACAEKFEREGVGATITVTSCWCYGSETMDMDPRYPKAVWGFNGTERPGAVYLAAVLAAYAQKGLPAFGIYGKDVQDGNDNTIPEDVAEKLLRFARAAQAVATMRGKSYLSIGNVSMGIAGSIIDPNFFQQYLGIRNEYVDMTEILRRIDGGIYDKGEFAKAMTWAKTFCIPNEGKDFNVPKKMKSREAKDADWEFVVKMTIIIRDMMKGNPRLRSLGFAEEALGHNAILAGFQGQRQWTDYKPNGDFSEAILNTSFDWNGTREALLLATENDSLNGAAMLFGHLLTNTAQIFSDVRTYWSPEAVRRVTGGKELTGPARGGIIHLINSGATTLDGTGKQRDHDGQPAMKPHWEITHQEAKACLQATKWFPANRDYFRGGGYSSNFLTEGGMPVTMSRVNLIAGLGPVLQIAEGWTVELNSEIHTILDQRTDKTWPTTWFVPRLTGSGCFKDVYSVMNAWGANHGAICFGHVGQDMITLAAMLRIPVCMHNVTEDEIFRPSAWNAFGMNKESADYIACKNFGPIYKSAAHL